MAAGVGHLRWLPRPIPSRLWGGVSEYLPSVCTKWPPGQPHLGLQLPKLKVLGHQAGQAELRTCSMWGEQGDCPEIFMYCSSSLSHKLQERVQGVNQGKGRGRTCGM